MGSVCLVEPNGNSDPNTLVFKNEHLAVVLFSRERSPISSFLILVVGIYEIARKTLAFQI